MHVTYNRTWTDSNNGRRIGLWNSIPRNVKPYISPLKGNQSDSCIIYMVRLSKKQTQQNISESLCKMTSTGTNILILQPRKPTTPEHFLKPAAVSKGTKELCYKAMVRPIMEYASVIWDPSTDTNIHKLEMVQRRAARMVFSDFKSTSSVTPMLRQLQWSTLQERRAQTQVVMMYRIVYHLVDISSYHLTPTISVRGHNMKFLVPYARTSIYQKSFFPDTIRLWNSLPRQL